MNGIRWGIVALLGTIVACSADVATAQYYGGYAYGPARSYSGVYAGAYLPGTYPVGGYYASAYRPSYTYGPTYYGIGSIGTGATYGIGGGTYTPTVLGASPLYGTQTTIIRGGPTGGVMQYSSNGDGYTYIPDSTYPTLIQNQPSLGLSRMFVQPSPTPTVIESRPPGNATSLYTSPALSSGRLYDMIKISLPKTASGTLTYSLNGHLYTIQPGYSQTFRNDRPWTIEFKRGAERSDVVRIPLSTGTYAFSAGANGWDLQPVTSVTSSAVPPAPLPADSPTPIPPLNPGTVSPPALSPAPTPLPPP